jgi:hypothetical protein
MRKLVGVVFLPLLAFITVHSLFSQAASTLLYVNKTDPTCQGHTPCYNTIQAAVDAAQPGDTIRIQPGQYKESVLIQGKNSFPQASESDRIIIEADPAVQAGKVKILGDKNHQCTSEGDAVQFSSSHFITLRGVTIQSTGSHAITLNGGIHKNTAIHLERNRIFNTGPNTCGGGILIGKKNAEIVVVNSLIYGTGLDGVAFSKGAGGPHYVVSNTIHGNGQNGVRIGKKQEVLLINNLMTGNGAASPTAATNGFGIKRTAPAARPHPEKAQLLRNLICGNAGGELSGPVLDGTDGGNLTPTGTEGTGVSASAGCQLPATVYTNMTGLDGLANTADDDFSLAAASPAIDGGIDPRTPIPEPSVAALFTADFTKENARPRDGDGDQTVAFDLGRSKHPEDVSQELLPPVTPGRQGPRA